MEVCGLLKEKPVTRRVILWPFGLIILLLIVLFSVADNTTFETYYHATIKALPLSDSLQRYLGTHYKLGHPICYAALAVITCLCLKGRYLFSIILVFSFGALLEVVQFFLPTRSTGWIDLGYNLVGILAGAAIVFFWETMSRGES